MNSYKRVLEILKTTLNRWVEEQEATPDELKAYTKNIYKNLIEYIDALIEIYCGEEEK